MKDKIKQSLKFKIDSVVGNEKNTCYLIGNNWDDYGFKTTFEIYYVDSGYQKKYIGRTSITCKGLSEGHVSFEANQFCNLPDNYCSLGQGHGYYEELRELQKEDREAILIGLRDCVFNQNIFDEFRFEGSVQNSLLRHVSEKNVKTFFLGVLNGNAIPTKYCFSYQTNTSDTKIEINVVPESNPPSNIHVLIGRNGVGKTRILSGIADNLTANQTPSEISMKGEIIFDSGFNWDYENTGSFSNVVTVAFSAFDKFTPMNKENNKIPCEYIGLKKESGNEFKSPESLEKELIESLTKCLESQRKQRWIDAVNILNSDPIFKDYNLDKIQNINEMNEFKQIFTKLSSGHKIILLTICKLVEYVDDKTLVLIDEPECHLHPPLLSSFIRSISDLLIKRNAVAIIATHSPVVLQEVPKSCVTKIDRAGESISFSRPKVETYAENIGTLTREIFQLELMDSGFYKTISDYVENKDYESLIREFGNEIGAEGRAIARSIIATRKNKDA